MSKNDLLKILELAMSQTTAEEFKVLSEFANYLFKKEATKICFDIEKTEKIAKSLHMDSGEFIDVLYSLSHKGFFELNFRKKVVSVEIDEDLIEHNPKILLKNLTKKQIVKQIRDDYHTIKSLFVNDNDGETIELLGLRYVGKDENLASSNQISFLASFNNVHCYASDLEQTNKWFVSTCIEIARTYPEQNFDIVIN